MLNRYSRLVRQALLAGQIAALVAAFFAAYALRSRIGVDLFGPLIPLRDLLWVLGVSILIWMLVLPASERQARRPWPGSAFGGLLRFTRAHATGALLLFAITFLVKGTAVSRLFVGLFLTIAWVLMPAARLALERSLSRYLSAASIARRLLVIGTADEAAAFLDRFRRHASDGVEVVGWVPTAPGGPTEILGAQAVGELGRLPGVLDETCADEVVLACPDGTTGAVADAARLCNARGLRVRIVLAALSGLQGARHYEALDAIDMLTIDSTPPASWALVAKRAVDIVAAVAGLVAVGIAWAILGRRIARESGGSVFFEQIRVGLNGRRFVLYKFRTMRADAESQLESLKHRNEMEGPMFKVRDDPRVTRLGRALRRHHIDELPQFWNVLVGDMSLIGTRPPTAAEVAEYRPDHLRRISMRPGITGLWQVNGRVHRFEEVVRLDCVYIDNWSLLLDAKILAQSIRKVLSGTGA